MPVGMQGCQAPGSNVLTVTHCTEHALILLDMAAAVLQASAADYFAYSSHLASWGFAVLQYGFNLLPAGANGILHTDEAEVLPCRGVPLLRQTCKHS